MMETMSKADEARVTTALEKAIGMTNGGMHPNDALHKVAEESRFTPPVIQRMAEAYNVSRTLAHMKSASGADRAKEFPIADAAKIVERMYPEQVVSPTEKAAAALKPLAYARSEEVNFLRVNPARIPLAKSARLADYPRDEVERAHKLCDRRLGLQRKAAALASDYRNTVYAFMHTVDKVAAYFRRIGREPFETVERKVAGEFGKAGRDYMGLVHVAAKLTEKRAEFTGDASQLICDTAREPYRTIAQGIKLARDVSDAAGKAAEAEIEVEEITKAAGLTPRVIEPNPLLLDGILEGSHRPFEKNALIPSSLVTGAIGGALGAAGMGSTDPDAARRKAEVEVYDPIHEAQMRSVQTQAMLNDFVSNDPIISGYDSPEVLSAYNQLAQLAPSLSTQPAVMRGLLRRMLQQEGVVEPHEASQLSDIERKMRPEVA
jgi:hypothetical protein